MSTKYTHTPPKAEIIIRLTKKGKKNGTPVKLAQVENFLYYLFKKSAKTTRGEFLHVKISIF